MTEAAAECGMTVPELIDFLVMTGDLLLVPDDGDQPAYAVPEWNNDVRRKQREVVIPEQTEGN